MGDVFQGPESDFRSVEQQGLPLGQVADHCGLRSFRTPRPVPLHRYRLSTENLS